MKYRLADPTRRIPLPWRGGKLFDADNGEEITDALMLDPFCQQLIKDRDIIPDRAQPPARPAKTIKANRD